ncbi:MAG TPA: hypothetical protein VLD39_10080 [Gammaproteobacteria bacterium]|nr:hypothetical protein [Gammaproteobacteria bacterium]
MPSAVEIVQQLAEIASGWRALAVFWHIYFGSIVWLLVRARPSRRTMGVLLALPLLSVSSLAWKVGNPFNGSVFLLAAVALSVIALKLPLSPLTIAPRWITAMGVLMAGFGWAYPHFLDDTASTLTYVYAAPTGLIPCPTLAMLIGLTLIVDGLRSRAWSTLLVTLGLTYGVVGGAILEVAIDWLLVLGGVTLLIVTWRYTFPGGSHDSDQRT